MARDPGVMIKAYPPLSFQLTVRGESPMDYEIRAMGEFAIAGIIRGFSSKDGQNYHDIPLFFDELNASGAIAQMMEKSDERGLFRGAMIGACLGFTPEMENFSYMLGIEPDGEGDLEGYRLINVPSLTWAVFTGKGFTSEDHQRIWKTIYGEWFPATDYIHDVGPELEFNLTGGDGNRFEIWIPVKKGADAVNRRTNTKERSK